MSQQQAAPAQGFLGNVMSMFRQGAQPMAAHSPALNMNNPNPQMGNDPANTPALQTQIGDPKLNPQDVLDADGKNKSPEVDYSKLWEPNKDNNGPADLGAFSFNMDPAKIDQTIGQLDFTKAVTPEMVAKIAAGGTEAVSAMLAAMNLVGQQSMKAALTASVKVTETGIQTSGQRLKDNLPGLVRNEAVSGALREDNPLFNDPSTAPMMEVLTQQMAQKFPQASPQEVREHAKRYMLNFAGQAAKFTGKQVVDMPTVPAGQKQVQMDWSQEPI